MNELTRQGRLGGRRWWSRADLGKFGRRDLAIIFAAAIAVRLANLLFTSDLVGYALVEDSPVYLNGAQSWLESGFFSRPGDTGPVPETERMPLYHLFLIPFRWGFGDALLPVLVGQIVLDAATCVVIAGMGAMISRTVGVTAGLLAAAWPNMVIHSNVILGDSLFVFLITIAFYFVFRFLRKPALGDAALAGLFCGLAIITRPVALFIPVAMALAAPFISWRVAGDWRRGASAAVAVIVLAALPITPVVWRNATMFGTPQLTSQSGSHFLNWVVSYSQSLESGVPFGIGSKAMSLKLTARVARDGLALDKLNPFEISALYLSLAKEEFWNTPPSTLFKGWISGAAINLAVPALIADPRIRKLNKKSFMESSGSGLIERTRNFLQDNDRRFVIWVAFGMVGSAISLILQFAGGVLLLRKFFWPTVFGSLAIIYFLLINGPVGAPKYRLPFEPILIIFQSVAVVEIVVWWCNRVANRRSENASFFSSK